jgi:nucleoid DNA-binding protein
MLIRKLADTSGFYQKDIRSLLQHLDDVVFDCLSEATIEDDVQVQVVKGIKIGCKKVEPRQRVNPKTQESIEIEETPKPFAKFSEDFRDKLDKVYEEKKNG